MQMQRGTPPQTLGQTSVFQQNLFNRYLKIMGEDPHEYFYKQQVAHGDDVLNKLPES